MTIYTKFADIPAAELASLSTADRASLTYWMLVQTGTLPISALPKTWNVQEVVDSLPLSAGKFGNTLKVYAGDPLVREYGRDTVKSLHTTAKAVSAVTNGVLDWCVENGFARRDGDHLVLDGVLADLSPNTPKEPSPAAGTVTAPATGTGTVPVAGTVPAAAPKPAPEVIPAPRRDFTERELQGIRIALEQLVVAQSSPRPTPVTDIGLSPVMDCARELAVLLDATGPVSKNVLRERVRTKLRPYTTTALAFGVERGAFTLAGSPVRGGEYALTDPEALDLSWATIRSLSKSRKPARALAGTRGT